MKKITTFLRSTVFLSKTLASKALRRIVRIVLFLIIFSSFSSYAIAGIQEKQDIPKMVQRADLIIRGKVISTESQWKEDSRGRHIYTSVTVKILDKIKGNIKDDAFSFEIVGGTVDDIREVVSGTPAFEIDEDAIMFLAGHPLTIKQGINSKIPIYDGRVYRDDSEVTVDSFIQAIKILEQDPNASVSLREKDQEPTAGVAAADCFIYSGYKWPGTSPIVSYKINQNTSDCTGEGAAVQAAASSWNNVGAKFTFQYGGSCSSTTPSHNGTNCIMWGTTVYEDSFAETTTWVQNGVTIVECDVVFNDPYFDWSIKTDPCSWDADVQTIALHEFGHWLSLDDLYDSADSGNVMYGYGYLGDVKRVLQPCDIAGICYIYGCDCLCGSCEPEDAYLGTIGTVPWYSVSGNCGNCGKWVGQFVGEAGATYHFDLCPDSPGSGTANFNADIKITNGSCTIIPGAGQDGVCSSPPYLPNDFQWICSSNGTYYVIIAPYNSYNSHTCGGDSSDTFTLKYYKEAVRPCESCEPEDQNLGTIGTVVWGYSATGNCGNGGKWVGQFVGEAGATYHFDLCPDSPGSGTANFDADIKITNGSCTIIPGAGQDGVCSSPLYLPNNFQWTCSANGTYYVIIAPYNSYSSHTCNGTASNTFILKYYKECSTPGDFEPDCDVDWDDLAVLVDQWLQPPGTPSADIAPLPEGDGIVNFLDFAEFAMHWLEGI